MYRASSQGSRTSSIIANVSPRHVSTPRDGLLKIQHPSDTLREQVMFAWPLC